MKSLLNILLLLTCLTLFCTLFVFFYLLRPFTIIDHFKTKVVCNTNNATYEIGPNLIYIFDDKPDGRTEKNIRKLCEYAIINDYNDTYKTPENKNYRLATQYVSYGSWGDTVLITTIMIIVFAGTIAMALQFFKFSPQPIIFALALFFSLVVFGIFLFQPAKKMYCKRQIIAKLGNYKRSAYGHGLQRIDQDSKHFHAVLAKLYKKCVGTM